MGRILVTGAAGFIGAQVCTRLLADGHEVVGVDNLNKAYDPRLKQWRLARLQSKPGFRFHRLDITRPDGLAPVWQDAAYDAVVNLAARAGVRQSLVDPLAYARTNILGALNLLEDARRRSIPLFIQASTSSVYGGRNPLPFREDADVSRPLSPYAATKGAAEQLCHSYHVVSGFDVMILRYFTVFGPAGRPDMSIFRFIQWIAEDRPVKVYGDGSQQRDFTYVDDIARGTRAALAAKGYEVINLGSDRPVTIRHIIEQLEALIGRRARIESLPAGAGEVPATQADIGKARRLLGWSPQVSLEEGLGECVEWYRRERSWASQIATPD